MTLQCTPVIINYVSVSQLLYQTHPHTLFGMSLPLVFATYSPLLFAIRRICHVFATFTLPMMHLV